MRHLRRTAQFRGPKGEPLAGSIAEVHSLHLGGIEQWVMLRGRSLANPPLVILHGGPGFSDTGFFRVFNAPLEAAFTVVYWDQRGAGKSYDPELRPSSMTVERFIDDLDELVEWVRRRTSANKVVLLGHSWGSALGVLYAKRFPEKVAAYVGVAQVGDWAAGEAASHAFALAEAQRRGARKVVEKLRAIGSPPRTASDVFAERTLALRMARQLGVRSMWNALRAMFAPESSVFDLRQTLRGFRFTLGAMWAEVSRLNVIDAVPELEMPVFFFLGRKDPWVPPQASEAYFNALIAPSKKLVWFEESGHEPFVDESDKFDAAMIEIVRPVVAPELSAAAE